MDKKCLTANTDKKGKLVVTLFAFAPVLGQDFPEFCPTYRGLRHSQAERKLTLV